MGSAVIEKNIKRLIQSYTNDVKNIDLSYKETDAEVDTIEKIQGNAVLNAYKIWLQSSATDFHRNYGHAGFLDGGLKRYPFRKESEEPIKEELIALTAEKFPRVEIIALDVICDYSDKRWKIKLVVRDRLTGYVGAEQVFNGEQLEIPAN